MKLQMLMFINISAGYEDEMEAIISFSYLLETFIYLLTFLSIPFSHYVSSAARIFHSNTLMIIHTGFYHFYLYGISRFVMIAYEIQPGACEIYQESTETCSLVLQVASFTRAYMITLVNAGLAGVMIERIVATVYFATYEHHFYQPYFIGLILFGIFVSIALAGFFTFDFSFYRRGISNNIEICVSLVTGLIGLLMTWTNERRKRKLHSMGYTLSKKYQLIVNVKSMKILLLYILHTAINNIIYSLLYFCHFTTTSQFFKFTVMMLFCDRQLYEFAKRIFLGKMRRIRRINVEPNRPKEIVDIRVKDVNGKDMYTGANQDDYFTQLKAQWERIP
ncbi:unnamed protein product, partial [Mesorhabditis belari]|uniref:Gustatory receptor n=1 Tax=Mesorhabditis belari TaxID=2138241 RepID=A0AAF3ETM8_9BILA